MMTPEERQLFDELLWHLKNMVDRFHACATHSGSDPIYADLAVGDARAAIKRAEAAK
jgi:hypothetical protein